LTLGGHDQLEAAKTAYQAAYDEYEQNRENCLAVDHEKKARLDDLIRLVREAHKVVRRSQNILRRASEQHLPPASWPTSLPYGSAQATSGNKVARLTAHHSTAMTAAGGAGLGTAAAAGSWSLVALFGTASTGTAISTLGGAAASNATLAWLGGGALAAGGAGMAGGTLVLGSIALAPVVAISAWRSRWKAKEIIHATNMLQYENRRIVQALSDAQFSLALIEGHLRILEPAEHALNQEFLYAKSNFYPVFIWSFCKRWIGLRFGRPFYAHHEIEDLRRLEAALSNFLDSLRQNAETNNPS